MFVGIDLAGEAVRAAQAFARRAGVANVAFEALDLVDLPADAGAFDYIVAHGVYSWVPPAVRDALMALIGRHLAPAGVAFVSYNTFPGCHLRRMVWEMLGFHTAEIADPQQRLTEARALIRLLAHGSEQPDEYTQPLVAEAQRMEERPTGLLFHDDLAPVNDPVYFHEFAEHAARHRLQFLAEAAFVSSSCFGIAAEARGVLAGLDPISREQYLDFVKCRRFRETLLCRAEVAVERTDFVERMRALTFTAASRVREAAPDAEGAAPMRAVLDVVRAAGPHPLPFDALIERLRAHEGGAPRSDAGDGDPREIALACLRAGVIVPHVVAPRLAFPPGERPTASAIVRAQLADGDVVTSLAHRPLKIDDAAALRLLPLLDGTRDRAALRAALGDALGAGASGDAALEELLERLAGQGLLVA